MKKNSLLTIAVVILTAGAVLAQQVGVPGSNVKYHPEIEVNIGGKTTRLVLTGTALRTKLVVNVYAIGSYVEKGSSVYNAESLAAADVAKRLHLVMERTLDGRDMAEALRSAIRANYGEPQFNEEINSLVQYMNSTSVRKGDHIFLTHVPGIGLQINAAGKADFLIKNVAFSKAVWEIYLGKKNIGESIKKGLTSRL